jgi:hypothetical protein
MGPMVLTSLRVKQLFKFQGEVMTTASARIQCLVHIFVELPCRDLVLPTGPQYRKDGDVGRT